MTTGLRVRQKSKHFREQGPFLIQHLPDCLANKPAIIVEVRAGDADRVISGVKVQARLPDGVSRERDCSTILLTVAAGPFKKPISQERQKEGAKLE